MAKATGMGTGKGKGDSSDPQADNAVSDASLSKGHATPTRKEREASNLRPLVSNDRKAGNRESRLRVAESRERARIGMANGEEKYLLVKDRGVQRRYVRDYVDARFSIGELMIPVLVFFIVLTAVNSKLFSVIGTIIMWAFLIVVVLDCVYAGFMLKRRLSEKFGPANVQRGFRWYLATRAIQFRKLRLPKPQVKRGAWPV